MSVINDKLQVQLGKIPARIELYDQIVENAGPMFDLDNKGLEQLLKEHAQNLMTFGLMLSECRNIEDTVRSKVEEIESELYKKLNENNGNRVLAQRDILQYIKSESRYQNANDVLIEVVSIKRKLEAVVEALKQLGWNLSHITKIRVAALEDSTL